MKLRRRFSSSLRPLTTHRARSGLALSGVAVGVAALVLSRAIGLGAQRELVRTVEQLGTNLLLVKPLPVKRLVSRPQLAGYATSLTLDDADAIARLPRVRAAAPAIEMARRVKAGAAATKTTIRGTTTPYPNIRRFEVAAGRFFDDADERKAGRVAVLGARVNEALRPGGSLLGEEIQIDGVPFTVIGILRGKGSTADGADEDNQVIVPLRTALRRVFNENWLTTIYVSVTDPQQMSGAETEIQRLLTERHQRGPSRAGDDFAVQDTAKTRAFQQQMTAALTRYASWLGGIAMLIGGGGIMALMLVSVRERTTEIGLRMAVGARPVDVLLQFLIESSTLALAGWLGGVGVGLVAALAIGWMAGWSIAVPAATIVVSCALTLFMGVTFGSVPARLAARIPPIQALLRV